MSCHSSLEARRSDSQGHHVIVVSALSAGFTLIKEKPAAISLPASNWGHQCRCCMKAVRACDGTRHACSRCDAARYCSGYCARQDEAAHTASGECQLMQHHNRTKAMPFIREACLAARLLQQPQTRAALLSNQAALLDKVGPSGQDAQELTATAVAVAHAKAYANRASATAPSITSLPGRVTRAGTDQGVASEAASAAAEEVEVDLAAALEAVCQIATNALEVMPTFVEQVAEGMSSTASPGLPLAVYRLTSRINHSCCPNAAYFFTPEGSVIVRSLRALQVGEELTISYTDLLQTLDERQHSLQQHYCFYCSCARCSDDSPSPGDWFLDAVAADDLEAAQGLHLQVQQVLLEGKAMLLEKGAVSSAVCHMEAGLFGLTARGVHPLHHTCLDLYTCLSSACRMLARSGVSGILPHLARQLSDAALALCHCMQALLQLNAQSPTSEARGSKRRASDRQSDSPETSQRIKQSTSDARHSTHILRSGGQSSVSGQSEPEAAATPHETTAASGLAPDAPLEGTNTGQPWQSLVAVAVSNSTLLFQGIAAQLEDEGQAPAAAGLCLAELAGPDDFQQLAAMSDFALLPEACSGKELLQGALAQVAAKNSLSSRGMPKLLSLACSTAACLAGASAALKVAFGSGHKLWELNHFLPMSTGLPFPLAAALMQASSLSA